MATKPIETVLNRDLSRVNANELINRYEPMLEEIVNYGTNLYTRHSHQLADLVSAQGAPLLIYLHILEMTDGVTELLKESAVSPTVPVVRAAFESALGLEYMLEQDTSDRASAWIVSYLSEQIDVCEKILGHGKPGRQMQAALTNDMLSGDIDLSILQPIAAAQKPVLDAAIAKPEFATALAARQAVTTPYPSWYSLFGGPKNLRELAAHLKREAQYRVLYGHFSSIAHGQNIRRFLVR